MKVTAIIPDELVRETQALSNARNINEALIIALQAYIAVEKLKAMGEWLVKALCNLNILLKKSEK